MEERVTQVRWMSGLDIVLGVWILISPWVLNFSTSASKVNSTIFGAAIIIFGLIREAAPRLNWSSWINFLVGIWLVVSPFILQLNGAAAYLNLIIVGAIVTINSYANASTEVSQSAWLSKR
jgi:membrane-bound ClpP family serine protease